MTSMKPMGYLIDMLMNSNEKYPNAFILSTTMENGSPDSRTVLAKAVDEKGIVFVSNYESNKGIQIDNNPIVSALFLFKNCEVQIKVSGVVHLSTEAESDFYYGSRPWLNRIGAWSSDQSRQLRSRAYLLARVFVNAFRRSTMKSRPPFWGGYTIVPFEIEVLRMGMGRLHDRKVYTRNENGWTVKTLYP